MTDVFSLGASSRCLAKELISAIKEREPAEFGKKASLILIDRTLVSRAFIPQPLTQCNLYITAIQENC